MRLLLAEDEKDLSRVLVTILQHNHYTVDPVFDGEDALAYLESGLYDAAILDIMMPKMDGITVLKRARAKGVRIPILMLTAKAEVDDKVLGLESGANDYLTKPFATKELLARIRAMTRSRDAQDSSLCFADLSLNRATFELSGSSGSVRLPNKEYQMMELLMQNPHHVISTERFMEKIWGLDSEAELNVVWVYISYLRKKIASLSSRVQIRSNRNLGYSLEDADDQKAAP
ncbi:MAG: response regulator transcription factor [Clostridia bacterium]|nr:response regulator transcription factor [Clostridia bacterium]